MDLHLTLPPKGGTTNWRARRLFRAPAYQTASATLYEYFAPPVQT